jgi:hypothetical protein
LTIFGVWTFRAGGVILGRKAGGDFPAPNGSGKGVFHDPQWDP